LTNALNKVGNLLNYNNMHRMIITIVVSNANKQPVCVFSNINNGSIVKTIFA